MQTKRFKIYGGECTRLASIHPSIHPKLFINSTPRQKMFQSARAGKPKNWILYGGECAPLTSIHPSVHPSIHPSKALNKFFPAAENIFRAQEHANQKVKTSMAVSVRLLSHPSIHPRRVLGKLERRIRYSARRDKQGAHAEPQAPVRRYKIFEHSTVVQIYGAHGGAAQLEVRLARRVKRQAAYWKGVANCHS